MKKTAKGTKICYVLSYKSPNYVRTVTLVGALKEIKEIDFVEARNTQKGVSRYFQTIWRVIKIRFKENPDVYILGFRGHEIFFPVRILTLGKKLIFDAMMSPYDALRYEVKSGIFGRILSIPIYIIEWLILHMSSLVLTDTKLHTEMFKKHFNLSDKKVNYVYIGADEAVWDFKKIKKIIKNDEFIVFNYSTFVPLHGVEVILDVAKLLESTPIQFIMIGGKGKGKRLESFQHKIKDLQLKNVKHIEWVEFEELARYSVSSDICLGGPFGGTGQGSRVITGKTYQFLCLGKPTIIGKIEEDVGFVDKKNCLLVKQNDPKDLANAISWCYKNREKLSSIGKSGRRLYDEKFAVSNISIGLKKILNEILSM